MRTPSQPRPLATESGAAGAPGALTFSIGLRFAVISMGIGLVVVALIGLADPRMYSPHQFVFGALFGLSIALGCGAAETLLLKLNDGRMLPLPLRIVGYFVGGALGHFVMYAVTAIGFDDSWEVSDLLLRTLLFGSFAALVGVVFYAFEKLNRRLRHREAALREKEVAEALAEKELDIARSIQQRLLPPPEAEGSGYSLAARNVAAKVVGGDFYDVVPEGDRSLCVVVGDVAGKGVGASLIMASVKAMLPLVAADRPVEEILQVLNQKLFADLDRREFVALAIARIDLRRGTVQVANAGLPDPLLLTPGDDVSAASASPVSVDGERMPLGAREATRYGHVEIELQPGQRLLLYTDGLPEAQIGDGPEGELGYDGFADLVVRLQPPAREGGDTPALTAWLDALLTDLEGTAGTQDDQTLLVVERVAVAGA